MAGSEALVFGEWYKGSLHCAEGRCQELYYVDVPKPGRLEVDVYMPLDPGLPDFDLALLDRDGQPVAMPADPNARPRRLRSGMRPGRYVLRFMSRDSDDAYIGYQLTAKFAPHRRPISPAPVTPLSTRPAEPRERQERTRPSQQPERASPAAAPIASAEVLDVEREGDAAAFVLLDAGEPDQVEVGMRGQLKEGGATIGEFEIVEVYTDGSRARVIGELQGEVSIDTVAEIFEH